MDQLRTADTVFAGFVAECLSDRGFVLIDVGAAYGVSAAWRCFGNKLRGFGFEVDAEEVELDRLEATPAQRELDAAIELDRDAAFVRRIGKGHSVARKEDVPATISVEIKGRSFGRLGAVSMASRFCQR